jgi:hypothetical protein
MCVTGLQYTGDGDPLAAWAALSEVNKEPFIAVRLPSPLFVSPVSRLLTGVVLGPQRRLLEV